MPLFQKSRRTLWFVMLAAWAVAGAVIMFQSATMRDYVRLLNGQGLRGADAASTPLGQVIPARYADAQMWVRHAFVGMEAGQARVRFTTADNAPKGREVHWSSGFAWLIRGAAALQERVGGSANGRAALEQVLLWFNAPLLFGVVLGWSAWTARRAGAWAGMLLACAMVGHQRFQEPFTATYVDHHGLVNAALLGFVLGTAFMGFGWWRPAAAGFSLLPDGPARARHAAVIAALSGAIAMWLNAATALPAIALLGCAGLLVTLWHGRSAQAVDGRFDPDVWRLWGRTGGIASCVCYLIEYAPAHLGWRLEVNHPLYALAWWGGAELVATLGMWLAGAPGVARSRFPSGRVFPALIALAAAPLAIVLLGPSAFLLGDSFVGGLRHFVAESRSLPATVKQFGFSTVGYDLASTLIVIPTAVLIWWRRDETRLVLAALTFLTLGFVLLAVFVMRWWVVASVVQIPLLIWLVGHASRTVRERQVVSLLLAGGLFVLPTLWRIGRDYRANQHKAVDAGDLFQPLYRDLAATLRASQPEGDLVLLSNPNASAGISYYGLFQSVGTLFWENAPGLRAAAEMLCAETDEVALRLIRERGVTHVVMFSGAPFVGEYFALLHPDRPLEHARNTFGFRLAEKPDAAPRWLQPIPYRTPVELAGIGGDFVAFKVVSEQKEEQRLFHVAVAQAARGDTAAAEQSFLAAAALVPPAAHAALFNYAGESTYEHGAQALALRMFRRALHLANHPDIANITAWIMATSLDASVRDGIGALTLVKPLAQRNPRDPVIASTLAAAWAEAGRFEDAVQAAERAIVLMRESGGDEQMAALLARRLATYRAGRPWRQ